MVFGFKTKEQRAKAREERRNAEVLRFEEERIALQKRRERICQVRQYIIENFKVGDFVAVKYNIMPEVGGRLSTIIGFVHGFGAKGIVTYSSDPFDRSIRSDTHCPMDQNMFTTDILYQHMVGCEKIDLPQIRDISTLVTGGTQ